MAQEMSAPPEQQAPGQPPSDDASGPLTQMIIQTDQALSAIAQVLSKATPEAGQAMGQISEQFRQIIQAVMSQGGQQGQQQPTQMVSPETQGKPSMMAY
jgi:hypothetical protein